MMKRTLTILAISILAFGAFGCSSSSSSDTETPKGMKPDTVNAPPGSKNPEERGMEEQKKGEQDGGAGK